MTIRVDKDCFLWKLDNEFTILYLWWGIEPWWECSVPKVKNRIIEFGIGYSSWQILKYKV